MSSDRAVPPAARQRTLSGRPIAESHGGDHRDLQEAMLYVQVAKDDLYLEVDEGSSQLSIDSDGATCGLQNAWR
jgi:hypothetical protein